jgi:3-hydroxyisobutyrate dehydrogenase-like beta-hydroxyacid dehydrogenase
MGAPMAQNLIQAGHELNVFNRTASRTEPLVAAGAVAADTPAAATAGCELVITMLADDQAVRETLLGADGALAAMPAGAVHLSMSTIGVEFAAELAAAHAEAGPALVSCPVFGRPEAAAGAKLWILAAGPAQAIAKARPAMDAMGQGVFELGDDPVLANTVKLAGNFTIAAMLETLGEAYAMVRKAGLPAADFLNVVNTALFKSPLYENYGGLVANEKFEPPGFKLKLGLKDMRLVLQAADKNEAPMPLASLVHDHFLSACAQGMGEKDWAALGVIPAKSAGL